MAEEIQISELELKEDLAGDCVFPIESSTDTNSTTLSALKDWLKQFFVGMTDDETITGQKSILTTNERTFDLIANDIDSGTTPASNVTQGVLALKDKFGAIIGYIFAHKLTTGAIQIGFQAHDPITDKYSSMAVGIDADGVAYMRGVTPPNSANSDLLATTQWVKNILKNSGVGLATISKAQSGYCQFTNGLIINWGYVSEAGTNTTVTYKKAFSSATSYAVIPNIVATSNYGYPTYVKSRTASNFVVRRNDSQKLPTFYLAIGY